MPGFGAADGALGAVLVACAGLGVVWILGAIAIQNGGYRIRDGGPALGDPAAAQHGPAAVGPAAELAAAARPVPAHRGAGGRRRRRRAPGIARDPEVQEAAASVVKILGSACGLGVAGSGWVAGAGPRRHERARRGRRGATRRSCSAGASRGGRRRRSTSIRATTSRSCACPGSSADPLPLTGEPESGTSAAILGFPLNGPFDVRPGRVGDDAAGDVLRRLRARPGRPLDDRAARASCGPGTPAARWSTGRAGW